MGVNVKRNYKGFLDKYRAAVYQAASEASVESGEYIQTYLIQKMVTGPHTGTIYKLPDGTEHQASNEGEFPAWWTGDLGLSIQHEFLEADAKQGKISVRVFVDPSYWTSKNHEPAYDTILYEDMGRKWIPDAIEDCRPYIEGKFKQKALLLHDYSLSDGGTGE